MDSIPYKFTALLYAMHDFPLRSTLCLVYTVVRSFFCNLNIMRMALF